MPAEGVAWWLRFSGLDFVVCIVFDSFGFADFFFVSFLAAFKALCGEVKRFEDGDECDNACVPNAQSDRS